MIDNFIIMFDNFMLVSAKFILPWILPIQIIIWVAFIYVIIKICKIINYGFNIYDNIKNDLQKFINEIDNIRILDNTSFLHLSTLSEAWLKFSKHVNFDKKECYITPKEYFNIDLLIEGNDPKKSFRKALLNILPSIGLLCTFTFILLGLIGIDPSEMDSINNLVKNLSSKFATSVISLLIAVIFIWIEKSKYSDLNTKCINLHNILSEHFLLVTQTDLLVRLNFKLDNLIIGQQESISSTNEKLDNQLSSLDTVNQQLGTQIQTLNTFASNIQNNSMESLNQMVKTFQNTLSENTAKQFKDISEIITKLSSAIEEVYVYQATYTENMKQTNEIAENSLEKQKEIANIIEGIIGNMQDEINKYKELISKNNEMISNSAEVITRLSDITGELAYAGEQFNEAAPSLNVVRESISDLTENLNKSIEQFKNISNEFSTDKFINVINEFKQGIKDSLEEIQSGLNDDAEIVRSNLDWYDEQLNRLTESSEEVIEKVHNSMSEYSKQTNIFLDNYLDKMRQTISFLNNHVEELDKSMKNNMSDLGNNFTNLNNTLVLIEKQIKEREVNVER